MGHLCKVASDRRVPPLATLTVLTGADCIGKLCLMANSLSKNVFELPKSKRAIAGTPKIVTAKEIVLSLEVPWTASADSDISSAGSVN
jgi:hypothetical protein